MSLDKRVPSGSSPVKTGLEVLLEKQGDRLRGKRLGVIAHPASVDSRLAHIADLLCRCPELNLTTIFGPQHGARGETQDNMIEWESYRDPRTGLPVYSLYGKRRSPSEDMLSKVDVLIFDLQDVGSRYYTYLYTMALAMQSCARLDIEFLVLDRPNPIGGRGVEGNVLNTGFESFVGMYPLAARHGMTVGETARYFNQEFELKCLLSVVAMEGWKRDFFFDQTGLPWVMPSPNMPSPQTALVYPGLCLLEGTNVSEGRGTTRPFEISGAPWINPFELKERLDDLHLPGTLFRPLHFIPTFHKWSGECIGGVQIHVTDRLRFRPFRTGLALVQIYRKLGGDRFQWKQPPYEYEYQKLPFDVLCGTSKIRAIIEEGLSPEQMEACWQEELEEFERVRSRYLLY